MFFFFSLGKISIKIFLQSQRTKKREIKPLVFNKFVSKNFMQKGKENFDSISTNKKNYLSV